MMNRTIGIGDEGCWNDMSTMYERKCSGGEPYCATEMLADWLPKGEIQYQVKRGCSHHAPNEITMCDEGSATYIQFKDCTVTCDPTADGDGCNKGMEHVASRFAEKENPVDHCHQCYWKQEVRGLLFETILISYFARIYNFIF